METLTSRNRAVFILPKTVMETQLQSSERQMDAADPTQWMQIVAQESQILHCYAFTKA